MGRQDSNTSFSEDLDEGFEPALNEDFDEVYKTLPSIRKKQTRLVKLRRKAEERMEARRLEAEFGYDLD